MKLEANPELFVVEGGKTYLFSTAQAKQMFEMDKEGTIAKADTNWPKVAKSPGGVQRAARMPAATGISPSGRILALQ